MTHSRSISDTTKRLDENFRRCRSVAQIFSGPDVVGLRVRLRGLLLKQLQADLNRPKSQNNSGLGPSVLKTVELEWRKCGYEPIVGAKKIKTVKKRRVLVPQ